MAAFLKLGFFCKWFFFTNFQLIIILRRSVFFLPSRIHRLSILHHFQFDPESRIRPTTNFILILCVSQLNWSTNTLCVILSWMRTKKIDENSLNAVNSWEIENIFWLVVSFMIYKLNLVEVKIVHDINLWAWYERKFRLLQLNMNASASALWRFSH